MPKSTTAEQNTKITFSYKSTQIQNPDELGCIQTRTKKEESDNRQETQMEERAYTKGANDLGEEKKNGQLGEVA